MSKLNSNFTVNGNFSVAVDKPLDNRSVVETYDDLFNINTWDDFHYIGMTVSVVKDTNILKNGLYLFTGPSKEDVVKPTSWIKVDSQGMRWMVPE